MSSRVAQEHVNGCAVAAVAMATGLTYRQVLSRLGPQVEEMVSAPKGGMWNLAVFVALQRLGYAIALEMRGEWGKLRPDWRPTPISDANIAEVNTHAGGHVIFVDAAGHVLDPAADGVRSLSDYDVNWIGGVIPITPDGLTPQKGATTQ